MEGQATRQKVCWNCEARVDFGVENCPSCGVYLSTSQLLEQSDLSGTSYKTPYRVVEEVEIPKAPFSFADPALSSDSYAAERQEAAMDAATLASFWRAEMVPLSLLVAGCPLLLFSLALLLFSENGSLTLKWSGTYWYLYTLLSVAFLYFGWRRLDRLQED